MSSESETHPRPNYGAIFIALFVFTVSEICWANLHIPRVWIIVGLLSMAIIKATLVGMFYMHLKFEKILLAVIIVAPLAFSVILTLTVGADIAHIHSIHP